MNKFSLFSICSLALVACQSTEPLTTPAAPIPNWWASLESEGLDASIASALGANLELQSMASAVQASADRVRMAGADLLPQVGAGFDWNRNQRNFIGLPIPGAGDVLPVMSTATGMTIQLSWEVDLWGRISSGQRAAVADHLSLQAQFAAAQLSLSGQVAKSYFAWVEGLGQLQLLQARHQIAQDKLQLLKKRFDLGLLSANAIHQARASIDGLDASLASRQRANHDLQRQLTLLLGHAPLTTVQADAVARANAMLPKIPSHAPANLPADLLQRRPDVAAAESKVRAATARSEMAQAALYPQFSLSASGGTSSNELSDLLSGDFKVWSLGSNLLVPLFQGGRLRARRDAALHDVERLQIAFAQKLLVAAHEVAAALDHEFLLRQEHLAATRSSKRILSIETQQREAFARGTINALAVLQAADQSLLAQSRELTLQTFLLWNRTDLHLALGGIFPSTKTTPQLNR
ncbi:MAG: TolC family protein [Planctomycetes bacterium]|jgi:NodT family efflux transporter outer membrane factor (OMF) lipoprotein|nr:TolC family protein [Planctomycetota bacterium]MBT4029042.1 TolC family protein [Planctomycetota bacterium]MBT4560338.1 TolC family protein [Planctomycetota bacterium]MBT5102114.1 TolC family protein [Planctomycetota bacterium]MBT5120439.1 TolC family protein [Planctomycetota bacterium]